jgi:DNA-binding CsgD family transcriptional regulator
MRWPLVGRDAELRAIGDALASRAAGGVVLAGPAGVGKTRLATGAAELASARSCAVAWVRATRSAATIPLGAFGALLPAGALPEGVELLARARQVLAEHAGGQRLVLCVDDAQLLDDASAALVHQLVAAGEAFAVVTVRDGPVPDAVLALWKDELCVQLALAELPRTEVAALLEAALGGPVDARTLGGLWALTRGNALFLRELVRHGSDRGLLTEDGGVWRWHGEMRADTRLAELVDLRVGEAGAAERSVLELVAVGAPLELGGLEPPELAALEALEEADLARRRGDGRRRFADVAHPLQGEAVRARITPSRLEAIQRRLADGVEARGARRGGDLLRVATWRLESGTGDAELHTRAAERALGAADLALAVRFARAAVQAGGGFGAQLALGRALAGAGQGEEADRLLAALQQDASDDGRRAAVALARARNLFWALGRAADADGVLLTAERDIAHAGLRHDLVAQRVRLAAAQGRPRDALAAGRPLLDDPEVPEPARLNVALGVGEALFSSGRSKEALALVDTWLPAAQRRADELPHLEVVLLGMRTLTLRLAGRLIEATAWSERVHTDVAARRSAPATAVEGNWLGFIWLARGRVRTALRSFRESAALLRDGDAVGMRAVSLAGIAQACAQAGDGTAAREALAEMERTPLAHTDFEVELRLARAWTAAAAGELSRARAVAGDATEAALARGQDAFAARALHELCRLGGAASGLARLAERVDGPFASCAAAHAEALAAGDGRALLEVAERFAADDALLVAAEAADAAAAAHRRAGRDATARAAAARAAYWLTQCEGARPPTLVGAEAGGLTAREREIALLAASGSSSRDIADRLVVSVRTVDNHLQSAYRKLGVSRRQDLARVMRSASE